MNRTGTLRAHMGDNQTAVAYIENGQAVARRLTPTENAVLQGFPEWWCIGLETPEPTEEDIAFWTDVFETHWRITGKPQKPKTRNQIVKWLRSPRSDSAEYKMWGNSLAIPCAVFVLEGIAELVREEHRDHLRRRE